MNGLAITLDVAHCSEATVPDVADVATKPFLCTYSNLEELGKPNGDYPQFIIFDYASMFVGSGGVVGAWISVLTEGKFPGLIRHLFRMIDVLGIDRVGIGSDLLAGVV